MAQHDLIIDNAGGAVVRADINAALAALGSCMKGSSPPASPLAGMLWLEEDNPSATEWTLRIYDGADWSAIGVLSSTTNVFTPSVAPATALLKAGDTMTGNLNVPSLNSGPLAGMRNRIINGAMAVDQRNGGAAQTFTAGAALAYCVDRWYGYSTGANVTGQRVAGAVANTFRYRFTGAASVTAIGFGQRIEAANSADLAGSTVTLGVDLANSLLTSVTWTAYYANTTDTFGTLASPTRTQIATGTFTVTSTVTRYSTQISVPAAATTGIEIVFTVGAQTSGTWTIGNVQIEAGSVATPFERRPVGAELTLCQRYYEACQNYWIGNTTTTSLYYAISFYMVEKRATPSGTSISQGGAGNGGFGARSVVTLGTSYFTAGGTAVTGGNGGGWADAWAISAEL